ncbi:NAD+ synthase [Magnetospira sp. QH-2]|uniref:NAD+ synthase n=1 Tax=Magnetospira sp. (strain QH-2) TaxID=1288970 RepID=UPI0003E80A8B|nr:NAD+ synthase [Magnetospira sp. QH-2]CCQ75251.1 Glutamine-dependent NAD(+) synthetase [Magnetospira sp. QH-2]
MPPTLTIALAQNNPTVGALDVNADLVRRDRATAADLNADLVVFGELNMTGYPPEDLVRKPAFQRRIEAEVSALARETADGGPALLVGAPWRSGGKLWNAALLLGDGRIMEIRAKHHLPNYGVFDEMRVFDAGPLPEPMNFRGRRLGVMICEDMWYQDVARHLALQGAEMLIVPNGSPFEVGKAGRRMDLATSRARETELPLIYVNLVGGQDELAFDGASFVSDRQGKILRRDKGWDESVIATHWTYDDNRWRCTPGEVIDKPGQMESIYRAMVVGLRDYVKKNGFPGVVLGLSGGIDSALSAAVAVDALGPEQVLTVMMPSPYTSTESLEDASEVARLLGTRLESISIGPAMEAFGTMLDPLFAETQADTTEENIQSRSRGLLLMALSNKFGHMLLTTGNKSEMSVGYATLYGDMCGGYSVLKDLYKTTVFSLCEWRNNHRPDGLLGPDGPVMPQRVIDKPPSAELKPDQTDQDSLPPYDVLDAILTGLVEDERSLEDLVADGHDPDLIKRVWRLLDLAEYKRRQAPPGVKISARAFGRDRRYPITNGFTKLVSKG